MPGSVCESCRTAPVAREVRDVPEQRVPYRLCSACAHRLKQYSLRPLEYFHLAAKHGPGYALDSDFYDEDGHATHPDEEVEAPERFPAPGLAEVKGDLATLVDYALSRWSIANRPDILDALGQWDAGAVFEEIRRRVEPIANVWIEGAVYELCGRMIGLQASDWIRHRWMEAPSESRQWHLAFAVARCLPRDEAFHLLIAEAEKPERQNETVLLIHLGDRRVLDWMERRSESIPRHKTSWGRMAACNEWSWEYAVRWIERGRPLSLVALLALAEGAGQPDDTRTGQQLLEDYVARDNVPNVRRLVKAILQHWACTDARQKP